MNIVVFSDQNFSILHSLLFILLNFTYFSSIICHQEEEQRLRKVALNISKDIKKFWLKIEKLVIHFLENFLKQLVFSLQVILRFDRDCSHVFHISGSLQASVGVG